MFSIVNGHFKAARGKSTVAASPSRRAAAIRRGIEAFVKASVGIGVLATAAAVSAGEGGAAGKAVTVLPKGVSHTMPAGAAPEPAPRIRKVVPLRIPIGEEKLRELKGQSSRAPAKFDPTSVVVREAAATPSAPAPATVVTNCSNVGADPGFAPSDSHGAVSLTNLVTVKNAKVHVFTRCALVSAQSLKAFFGPVGVASTATLFDPRVLFDKATGRFFLTAESAEDPPNTDQFQYFAVSKDGTGTTWWLYRRMLSLGATKFCKQAVSSFWDFPSAGSSRTRWFITANDFGASTTGAILSIDKAASLTGGAPAVRCFAGLTFNLAPPIVLDTSTVSQFLSPGSGGGSIVRRLNLTASASGPASDTLAGVANVNVPTWLAPPDAVQPNRQTLDSLDGRFQSASIQSRGLIWNVHAIGLNGLSKIRLYKIGMSAAATTPLLVFTPTTVSGEHLFDPSFATGSGAFDAPAFMTASRTIPSNSTAGKPAFMMFLGLNSSASSFDWSFVRLGLSPTQFTDCFPSCRWGDYSATQIDPSGSGRAWGFTQLATGTTQFDWTMQAGQVELNLPFAPVANLNE